MAGRIAQVPCPHCGYAYTKVTSTRVEEGSYRRNRECLLPPAQPGGRACPGFTTWEVTSRDMQMLRWVKKFLGDLPK